MLPVLFQIGPVKVHSWGVLLMLGFLLATWRAAKNAPRYHIKGEDVWDVGLWGLLGGVIGARLVYVLLTPSLLANPAHIFHIWEGGMTFYGGLAGGILAGALVCRARGVNVADMADLAALSFPLGYALGRVGCFFNGCCYGGVCDLPWAVRFHDPGVLGGATSPSHPAQLYSALISLAIYGLLTRVERTRRFRGQLMLAYIFLYGVYRFCIEFVRAGATAETTGLANLTQGQIASLLLALAAAAAYAAAARRARRRGSEPAKTATTPSTV
jgi:phosphatidylglycerol:prolipoprotein diacylglycerol transferase